MLQMTSRTKLSLFHQAIIISMEAIEVEHFCPIKEISKELRVISDSLINDFI